MKVETELTEEVFQARKKAAEERRAIKAEEAATLAEMIEKGEIDQPLRNGRQGKGEWRDGVYRMDNFDPIAYLRLIADLNAKTPARVDPDVAFIQKLAAKFPHLDSTDREAFLTAVCSRLFEDDPDRLLGTAVQKLEALTGYKISAGELVSKYRRLPATTGSSQSLKQEDFIPQGGDV
jgi:hypothetical protein